jgi:hypothetical protein
MAGFSSLPGWHLNLTLKCYTVLVHKSTIPSGGILHRGVKYGSPNIDGIHYRPGKGGFFSPIGWSEWDGNMHSDQVMKNRGKQNEKQKTLYANRWIDARSRHNINRL